ncbi:NAD(P)H-dependent oxidoreductase [Halomonas campisalis]|uniref:NAD(P)H-dependent oxidoreductase n=1 Tax=Billgrantia campisalis TaxID=74661 RepID=A0ABS9P998_9GAMM|nr:NAD(P)H-dependent oxidoreductase [Halomonas campisalis]MCG6657802.1 NAD(P)H-dependent oxidoreductase [Halomonas campisalis]MDR5864726.1 NAD(P)H-dependent oxidoreductase [Halomonas campisalis]
MPRFLVFLGSARDSTPPSPARLGLRVARACTSLLEADGAAVELIDPLEIELGSVFKPHFAYAKTRAPEALDALAAKIEAADGYVMVSPEYNHSMSPALAHLLNHFGSSLFAFKPSAIVTYSAGQWGGARAAVAMRTFLAELGCLPVSAMIHVPKAQEALDEDGRFFEEPDRWAGYFGRTLAQLAWWSEAAARQRDVQDPNRVSPAFQRAPSQRNAPAGD